MMMSNKMQIKVHGTWLSIDHFAVEKINDVTFVSVILNGVPVKTLRSIADSLEQQFKPAIVAVIAQ